ncbi:hypothetical protein R1flu_007275 [Riccia fluitans]|uniref:CHCH domain-containing protein n=1 Tax=Riccia fluitans TaxID=41844 RepID=A0ABD1YYZ6_9MARC
MTGTPPCGREALALLNCVADKNYDESRCVELLKVLRSCVEGKHVKSFALDEDDKKPENASKGQETEHKKTVGTDEEQFYSYLPENAVVLLFFSFRESLLKLVARFTYGFCRVKTFPFFEEVNVLLIAGNTCKGVTSSTA